MDPGPQICSEFYLDAFLNSVQSAGYTIYTIRGDNLPIAGKMEDTANLRTNQSFLGFDYLKLDNEQNKSRGLNTDGADQSEMQAAINASIADMEGQPPAPAPQPSNNQEDTDMALAMAMSMAETYNDKVNSSGS
mmetsp:Transcript_17925/g.15831  ORF Transcript_17925/g.15831 Transcript_17925/m.15831 type:complete len:134 (+) Transcript_17925:409-810(+)